MCTGKQLSYTYTYTHSFSDSSPYRLLQSIEWKRKWQSSPVFLPGESQGWGAWWAAVYGVAQSQTRLKRRSSSRVLSRVQYATCFTVSPCWFYGNRIPESMVTPWDLGEFMRQWITQVTYGRGNLELSLNSFQYLTEGSCVLAGWQISWGADALWTGLAILKKHLWNPPLAFSNYRPATCSPFGKESELFPPDLLWSDVIYEMMKQRRNLEEAGVCSG